MPVSGASEGLRCGKHGGLSTDEQRHGQHAARQNPVDQQAQEQAGHQPHQRPGRGEGDPADLVRLVDTR